MIIPSVLGMIEGLSQQRQKSRAYLRVLFTTPPFQQGTDFHSFLPFGSKEAESCVFFFYSQSGTTGWTPHQYCMWFRPRVLMCPTSHPSCDLFPALGSWGVSAFPKQSSVVLLSLRPPQPAVALLSRVSPEDSTTPTLLWGVRTQCLPKRKVPS